MTEVGDLANSENIRMKYFPSSLTKNAFTWFTTLPPNSIDTWPHLERLFHEQFYMGQTKISLKELSSIKRKFTEPIDDYLNRFRLLKSRCFTIVPEHELVEMAAGGLNYSIRKKLDTQYLRDMAQLADRIRQVERLKVEKARANKNYKKERVLMSNSKMGSLKSLMTLMVLRNSKNPVETEKNDRFPKKTYTFDVTKCDEIFDLDLIQNAIKDSRLKFADKGKNQMKVDADPLNIADTNYAEPVEINMIDIWEVEAVKET
ncbi:uncharacterized protein LOC127123255 [Lathyrus oleraceus]|uniref:uncharacterized protein LOC127123255 n=1 Tax=Pisum sativum TaxID=3888 RepID=UPI0021D1E306|nr:uncharacterized protein LOC127123255 [Pisum sativum]